MHILSAYYELGYYGLSRDKSFNLILIKLYSEIGWHKNLTQSRTKKIKDFDDLITSQVLCSSKKKHLLFRQYNAMSKEMGLQILGLSTKYLACQDK